MILLAILVSAYLLWAACGFQGMPEKRRATTHITLSLGMVALALSALHVV